MEFSTTNVLSLNWIELNSCISENISKKAIQMKIWFCKIEFDITFQKQSLGDFQEPDSIL